MANRPKDKGTWAETQLALYLRENGWPYAERRALAGATDKGDITGTPGIAWEMKYANAGIKMGPWMAETCAERVNASADHGVLVVKPRGHGAAAIGKWVAVMVSSDYEVLMAKSRMFLFSSDPAEYQSGLVVSDLKRANTDHPGSVLVRRPPRTKERPEEWYRIMYLEHITHVLRAAGYGTPL